MKYLTLLLLSMVATTYSLHSDEKFDPTVLCPFSETIEHKLCHLHSDNTDGSVPIQLCGLLDLFNEQICSPSSNFDPTQLCPLVEMIDQELCQSEHHYDMGVDPSEFCPLFELFDQKVCQH
jgi:hypothetical protein